MQVSAVPFNAGQLAGRWSICPWSVTVIKGAAKPPVRGHRADFLPQIFPDSHQAREEQLAVGRGALPVKRVIHNEALRVFGFIKGHFTGTTRSRSAAQTMLIGGLAASVAYLLARAIRNPRDRALPPQFR